MNEPLAERIRPKRLEELIGQQHLVGPQGALSLQIRTGTIPSMIFWGPPGTGKTTLAQVIAGQLDRIAALLAATIAPVATGVASGSTSILAIAFIAALAAEFAASAELFGAHLTALKGEPLAKRGLEYTPDRVRPLFELYK